MILATIVLKKLKQKCIVQKSLGLFKFNQQITQKFKRKCAHNTNNNKMSINSSQSTKSPNLFLSYHTPHPTPPHPTHPKINIFPMDLNLDLLL